MNQTKQVRRNSDLDMTARPRSAPAALQLSSLLRRLSSWTAKKNAQLDPAARQIPNLLEASTFAAIAERQLRGSLHRKRHLSLAVFDVAELAHLGEIHGSVVSRELTARLQARLALLAGAAGAAAQIASDQYAVLLPGLDRPLALQAISRVMGQPARVQVQAGDTAVVLAPSFEVECANNHDASMAALQRELSRDLKNETTRKAEQAEAPHRALALERKPVLVWPDDPAVEHAFATRAAFAATVPMGLTLAT